eukprot:4791253-Pleurochrysis_carterae.AAC.2
MKRERGKLRREHSKRENERARDSMFINGDCDFSDELFPVKCNITMEPMTYLVRERKRAN